MSNEEITDADETYFPPELPDPLLNEPTRFKILNALHRGIGLDHTSITRLTGLPGGSVSKHLSKLEEAGMIKFKKVPSITRPRMEAVITAAGETALDEHWLWLEKVRSIGCSSRKPEQTSRR